MEPNYQIEGKAMLSIFYGRRVLRLAQIVPDKKKNELSVFFSFFSSDIVNKYFYFISSNIYPGIFADFPFQKQQDHDELFK